ncbi:MAG: LemA family protein [Burkholderiales bacterium]|nr:LemA family protein [Burkholderiales bacterium]
MSTPQIVALAVAALAIFWAIGAYNRLVRLRNAIGNAYAQIDVQLKRRHDLIPNIVEVARRYLQHEQETLERVTAARGQARAAADIARSQPTAAGALGSLALAEGVLDSAMSKLMAVVEAYPELKADAQMRELSEELTSTENKVAFARQLFNDAVLDYNNAAQQVPTNIVAAIGGFHQAAMLQATQSPAEREPVRVAF